VRIFGAAEKFAAEKLTSILTKLGLNY